MTGSVLDIGCGDGRFLFYLRDLKPNLTLTGVDGSSNAIDNLKSKGIEAHVLDLSTNTDLEKLRAKFWL